MVEVNRADRADVRLPRGGDDRPRARGADRPAGLARRRTARASSAIVRTGHSRVGGHPLEAIGMRADGSEFPVELIVTRPELPGPPLFCGYLRDVTETRAREREQRRLADEQAALRRVATAVAASDRPAARVRGRHRGGRAAAAARRARTWSASTTTMTATVVGGWSEGDVRNVPVGDTVRMDGDTASARVYRTRAPARVDDYERPRRRARRAAARARLPLRRRRADLPRRAAVGRGDRLQRRPASRSRTAPSSGSPTSPSSPRRRWPTPTRARSSPPRAPASSRRATPSAGGWSATCTTARSSGSSRWR